MTDAPRKPQRLRPGNTVAVLSPSWGGPSRYPAVFDLGLANLRELFGVVVRECPTTRMDADALHRHPEWRARDLNVAFADPDVAAIVTSIGGDDSVRLLPYLDGGIVAASPKILLGFSDTTTLLAYCRQLGMVTFNGPSVMAGFAQLKTLPRAFAERLRQMLMEPSPTFPYEAYPERVTAFEDWGTPGYSGRLEYAPNPGWVWLQGEGVARGRLFGGCIEVLEFTKSTRWWPAPEFWQDTILFLETSEEKPTPDQVKYMLRNYGMQGVLDKIAGLLLARPMSYSAEEREKLHQCVVSVVAGEFGRPDLPIVAEMDFGHEAPQDVMPLGVLSEIDCPRRTVRLVEAAVR